MKDIISHLNKNFSLSLYSAEKFAEIITLNHVENGSVFVEKGRVNEKEYLLFDGICRSSIVNTNGADITLSFFTSNTAISPSLIRTKSNTSILNIQALTDATLATFLSEDLMTLMNAHRGIEAWANAVLQAELLQKVTKEINQNSMNAKERLIHFRTQYPLLENLIPHSYISSYLGITNVSLSRLRKELTTN